MSEPNTQATHTSIAAATGMGPVQLAVTDSISARSFYRDILGLTELLSDDGNLHFGTPSKVLVILEPGAAGPVVPRRTGLYHLAIVVPSRRELARVIARLMNLRYPNSPTDHIMTKSDYLWDPDGNGIEVYAETPEDGTWRFGGDGGFFAKDKDGNLRSGRDPIDLDQLFTELQPHDKLDAPIPDGSKMGHVHLHVRDIDEAVHFYTDLIGFDLMGRSDEVGMAFVSAGGYHHHVGLNTWAGKGAPPAPAGTAGLRKFTIELPTQPDLEEVITRLKAGKQLSQNEDGYLVEDPSLNKVLLTARA